MCVWCACEWVRSCFCNVYSELRIGVVANKWWRDACNAIGIFVSKHKVLRSSSEYNYCLDGHFMLALFSTRPMWTYRIAVAFANWYCHIHKNQVTRKCGGKKQNELRLYFIYRLLEALCNVMCACAHDMESANASSKRMLVMPFFTCFMCDFRIFTEIFKWHWQHWPGTWSACIDYFSLFSL